MKWHFLRRTTYLLISQKRVKVFYFFQKYRDPYTEGSSEYMHLIIIHNLIHKHVLFLKMPSQSHTFEPYALDYGQHDIAVRKFKQKHLHVNTRATHTHIDT